MSSKHLIVGDFNIHMNDVSNCYVKRFSHLLDQYSLCQYVHGPTHIAGHTIDLILARDCDNLIKSVSVHDYGISDHSLVLCKVNSFKDCNTFTYRNVRNWKTFNFDLFEKDLSSSPICDMDVLDSNFCVSALVHLYNETMSSLLDKHAPTRTIRCSSRKRVPWFSPELNTAIHQRRRLERLWRRTQCAAYRAAFVRQRNLVRSMVTKHKRAYYKHSIDAHCSPRELWYMLNSFVKGKQPPCLPTFDSEEDGASAFATFFHEKIRKIRDSFSPSCSPSPENAPACVPLCEHFDPVMINEAVKIISETKPKTCLLDPIPTWIVKKLTFLLAPIFCAIANVSLSSGVFPQCEKCALITPVMKKSSLDKEDLNNYRPISNLSFISKFIERVVSIRIDRFLFHHNLISPYQSAYRPFHSTETVLLRLCNDIAVARGKHLLTCVIMLDLSAAFDTVDHTILLDRLSDRYNFSGVVLKWFSSYLKNRYQIVRFNSRKSSSHPLLCGVPQGSVLGPRLYSLYVSPISSIIESYELSHHIYADDTCLYFSFSPADVDNSVKNIDFCIHHLCDWFNSNRLKLNCSKTNFVLFNSQSQCPPICINVSGVSIYPTPTVRYLGVTLDNSFSFEHHAIEICKSSFAFMRSLYRICSDLPQSCVLSVVNAFVFSRIDYCNSVLTFCNNRTIGRLQRVQNCLVRLVKRLPRQAPTSRAIRNLRWLRIHSRIVFKICCLVHKCIYGSTPSYVGNLISFSRSVQSSISLRSHSVKTLYTPITPFANVRKAFYFKAPRLWNSLPLPIRLETRYDVFKRRLKAHLL